MPGVPEHLAQAVHNEQLFTSLDHDHYSDWAVTVLFYAALQYMDAYLASIGVLDPGGHDARDKLIKNTAALTHLYARYRRLKNFSRTARYYAGRFTRAQIHSLQTGPYDQIKVEIQNLLRPPASTI